MRSRFGVIPCNDHLCLALKLYWKLCTLSSPSAYYAGLAHLIGPPIWLNTLANNAVWDSDQNNAFLNYKNSSTQYMCSHLLTITIREESSYKTPN